MRVLLFLLVYFTSVSMLFSQNDETVSSKNFHFGFGISPLINGMKGNPTVGQGEINCFLLDAQYQGDPYNYIIQNQGVTYIAPVAFLRFRAMNIGNKIGVLLYAPIELGFSKWQINSAHGVVQQCEDTRFQSEEGLGHLTTGLYANLSFGYGANPHVTSYKGFGISLGIERTQSSLYMTSNYLGNDLPDYDKTWLTPSFIMDFKLEDRKERFYQVNLKYSLGQSKETIVAGGAKAKFQTEAYSISIIRIFGY